MFCRAIGRFACVTAIERGYPLSDEWFGNFRRHIQASLKHTEAITSTEMDQKALPLPVGLEALGIRPQAGDGGGRTQHFARGPEPEGGSGTALSCGGLNGSVVRFWDCPSCARDRVAGHHPVVATTSVGPEKACRTFTIKSGMTWRFVKRFRKSGPGLRASI